MPSTGPAEMEPVDCCDPGGRQSEPPFWSPWATAAWGLVVAAIFVAVQVGVMVAWLAVGAVDPHELELHPAASALVSGDLFAVATLTTAAICGVVVWVVTAFRARRGTARALGLRAPAPCSLAVWCGVAAAAIAASDLVTLALGRPLVPTFMTDLVRATRLPALLWPAIVVAAPAFEELLMRGFLLEGLRRGRLGPVGAVVATSFAWAAAHLQYDAYEVTTIVVFGLVLGAARLRSGSLWVPFAMHLLVNLVATVETLLVLAR